MKSLAANKVLLKFNFLRMRRKKEVGRQGEN